MNEFFDQFCPGFMVVPRKPHPFGNEYHTICDGDQGRPILWWAKIQEGKDRPKKSDGSWAFRSEFEVSGNSKTVVLMLEMTEPIHGSGKVVTMDSGFCVSAGILAMHAHGVYGQALIKKRGRYWPRGVPGAFIDNHFRNKGIGEKETLVQNIDGINFLIHCQKEEKYVTKMMCTYGLIADTEHITYRRINGEWKSFPYPEVISRHMKAKHWVDDFNNRRHDPICLADTFRTKWWPHRQFTFILGVAEANANNSRARARGEPALSQNDFRKKLAKEMLENKIQDDGTCAHSPIRAHKRNKRDMETYKLVPRPPFTSHLWDFRADAYKKVRTQYLKSPCNRCKKEVRTVCTCDPHVTWCGECYVDHCREVHPTREGNH